MNKEWCIPPKANAEFVYHMENVLDLYLQPEDPDRPLVCFDESSKQLIGETRTPLPAEPAELAAREDHGAADEGRVGALHARVGRCIFPACQLHSRGDG
ncbi:MAG: hypothetical protein NVS4B8_13170 [Herpetosiphon sp.]